MGSTLRREHLVLAMGSLCYAWYTYVWFTLPAFLSSVIADAGLSTSEAGLLVGAVPLVYVPFGLASGMLIDRIGARRAITVGLVGIGLVQIARGLAGDFIGLLVPTLFLGVAGTAMTFGLPKLVSELFPADRIGRMTSVYQVCSLLGSAAAFGLSRPVVGAALGGWRPAFVATGVAVLVFAVAWLAAVSFAGRKPDLGVEAPEDDDRGFSMRSARADLGRLLGNWNMLLLVTVGTMFLFVNHGLRGWLAVIMEGTGLTPETAGFVTSLLIFAQISGTLTIPALSDRWGMRKEALMACGGLCALGTAGLLLVPPSLLTVVPVVWAVGMGLGGVSPMIKLMPTELDGIGPALTATAVSLVYAVGELGGFGGPFVIGALRDTTGSFEAGLLTLVVASGVIVLASGAITDG